MKYVLDTSVVSRLMRLAPRDVGIPEPVFAEIAYGVERLPKSRRKDLLRESLEAIRAEIHPVVWSAKVTEEFASIKAKRERAGRLIEDFEIAIAAHARATGAVLVTANSKHMERIDGLEIEDWSR